MPFFGKLPIRLHGYENRPVPFESKNPLYVLITYKDGKNKNFEYSAGGNYVYYKATGTAVVKKIEGNAAYVTVNIIEEDVEGRNGIEKRGEKTGNNLKTAETNENKH